MAAATLRFYAELNDFLPPVRRKRDLALAFAPPCPVRHLVETCGVPHTEVELILLNGVSVGLDARVADGDRISVYPVFESLDVTPLLRLRPRPLRDPRFLADAHLGRLARYLRLLGFDTLFHNDLGDAALARLAAEQGRILLTRDRGLLMRREVTHGGFVRSRRPPEQLQEVLRRWDLFSLIRPFSRCTLCNAPVAVVDKAAVAARLPPASRRHYDAFWQCQGCGQLYWRGGHYRRLQRLVEQAADALRHGA
jgi:hypothetical protein